MARIQTPEGFAHFPAETIILGFTGSIGSGCTYIADGIAEFYNYKKYTLSDILREIAKEKQISPATKNLQDIGNELRQSEGISALVVKLLAKITSSDTEKYKGIIIDSIRNDGEVMVLRQFPNFYLFSIHADIHKRKRRCVGRRKRFKTDTEFDNADKRDRAEDAAFGQQVEKCNDLADLIVNNHHDIPSTNKTQRKELIDRIHDKYILPIERKVDDLSVPERVPTVDECLMTMAYTVSKRSSCLKRKVGCIIALVSKFDSQQPNAIKQSYHVISSGYNEVPVGSVPCIFMDYEKCYRDHLQEIQAEKFKHCPHCGKSLTKIINTKCKCGRRITNFVKICPKCKREIKISSECKKCGKDVYGEFLIGGGKLLDMCRSLHAEENALLYLTRMGDINMSDIVLYTTTYPCTLCANKIVTAGIERVVYADPYTMEDARVTLETAGVAVEKFEGLKSSAYFRLYR